MLRRLSSGGIFAAIMLVLAALAPSAGAAPRTAVNTPVTIQNFAFGPTTIAIHVGDTVTWTNSDTAPHTATALDRSFDSGRLEQGQTFAFTFTKAGTFDYICSFHESMTAKVEVMDMSAPAAPAAPAGQAPSGSLDASDQPLADGGVTVAKVNSSVAGWVVVHLDENNAPGKVLGQTAVPAGDSSNVVVKLSESVPVGGKVWPMLHIDAGAAGTYEFPGADVPVKVGDNIVMKQITITQAAAAPAAPAGQAPSGSLDASDQPLADGGVTVAKVNSSVAGWVVVHLDENNAPGKVLGQTAVPAGDSSNVVVKLSESVPVGGKVWPMLHIDAGVAGTYEFPGADVPVKVGDNIVMKQITITQAASGPANLPNTGGEDVTLSLVGGALALLALGALGRRRMRK